MGCGCQERGVKLTQAVVHARNGDIAQAVDNLRDVQQSAVEDIGNAFRTATAAARARLMGRR